MLDELFDLALSAAEVFDDISEEVTGVRPVEDTAVLAVAIVCELCGEKKCQCKRKRDGR